MVEQRRQSYPVKINYPQWAMSVDEAAAKFGGTGPLLRKLLSGEATAVAYPIEMADRGVIKLLAISAGRWMHGDAEEWLIQDRIMTTIGRRAYPSLILVRRETVPDATTPAPKPTRPKLIASRAPSTISKLPRKRGPKATTLDRVIGDMRQAGGFPAIHEMKEEAMKAQFGASRETCRKARGVLESEFVANSKPKRKETPTISEQTATSDK